MSEDEKYLIVGQAYQRLKTANQQLAVSRLRWGISEGNFLKSESI